MVNGLSILGYVFMVLFVCAWYVNAKRVRNGR